MPTTAPSGPSWGSNSTRLGVAEVFGPDDVRAACAFVAERAALVRIDDAALENLAQSVRSEPVAEPDRLDVDFALTFNAVNFGSGWHPYMSKLRGKSGNVTLSTLLRKRFDADGAFTAAELARVTADDCARVFGQHLHPPVDELMGLFAQSWNDLGRFLLDRFDGSFSGLVESVGDSGVRLVALLQEMPMYRDVASYSGRPVPLLKRAQISASDIGGFADLNTLTLFADNLIPHVLRIEGVLVLDDDLAADIDAQRLLEPGGQAETELRAVAVHAVERMVAELDGAVAARQLDNLLWRRGQEPRFKATPRPRARTIYY
ncbi:MAG: hypothetical protein JO155_09370 [Acidimicrobiia bacterium]|nr:hypothetical protein [Acidimicrobiia bacterium]